MPGAETAIADEPLSYAPFRALRRRFFRRFFIGQVISLTGSWMQGVAQRWLVYVLTGSASLLGVVNALGSLPAAALVPFSGVVADRFEKRRILIWAQIIPTFLALALWALTASGWVRVWHIVALALVLGLVRAFEIPARQSIWVEIVGKRDLMSAITLNSASMNLTRILGPSLAGVVIAQVGIAPCFLLNALSFLAPLWVLLRMPPTPVAAKTAEPFWASLRDGFRFFRGNKPVRRLLALVGAWSFFGSQFDVLLPAITREVYGRGASGYGFLAAALGVGALVGAMTAASVEPLGRRGWLVVLGSAVAVLGLGALAFVRSYALALACLFVLGIGMVMQNATSNTLIQMLVPDELRGRVMGIYSFMFIGLSPLGSLFYAALAHAVGSANALAVGALGFGVSAALVLLPDPAVRRLK